MFRTELPLTPHPQQLPLSARVLTIGSCFSDSIGSRLADFKVATMVNPFGTVFNPVSACKLLRAAAGEDMDWQQHLVEARGRWQSYDLHAEVGANSPVELLQQIQVLTRETGVFLATADVVVLTLGTAYAYRLRETEEIISNCHKIPAEKFEKELLTAEEIIAAVAETHAYLRRINPRLRFVLTVSPVRHIKETLLLNSTSKSMLRIACHYLSELLPDISYFPAYELLLDDLRDYRFYASDMLHPSEVAENYIWERFTRTYFDTSFGRFKKEWESIRQAMGHRPLYTASTEHRQFLEGTLERLRKVSSIADVRMEILHVERELAALPIPIPLSVPEPEEEEDEEERIDIGTHAEIQGVSNGAAATLIGAGAGVLLEDQEEDDVEQIEAEVSPESAYEYAYTATSDEEDLEESDELVTGAEDQIRKKKRRSRGGAKRTKRKHARLAAEAADASVSVVASLDSEAVSAEPEKPAASAPAIVETGHEEPASEVIYITEEALRRPTNTRKPTEKEEEAFVTKSEDLVEPTAAPVLPAVFATQQEAEHTTTEDQPRRSRNNRRGNSRPERTTRNSRPALYATTDAESTAQDARVPNQEQETPAEFEEQPLSPAPVDITPTPVPAEPVVPIEAASLAELAPQRTPTKPRAPRPASTKKKSQPAPDAPSSAASDQASPSFVPTQAQEVGSVPLIPVATTTRKRPASKAAASAPTPEVTPDVAAAFKEKVTPSRKRPPRKPKTPVSSNPAVEDATPEATSLPSEVTVPAKRRQRPPRRKPPTDTPETV